MRFHDRVDEVPLLEAQRRAMAQQEHLPKDARRQDRSLPDRERGDTLGRGCHICNGPHTFVQCNQYRQMPPEEQVC